MKHTDGKRWMTWMSRVRLRVVVFVIGIPLAAFGAISLGPAWLALPLMGVAVAAVTMTVNRLTERLALHTCWTCGEDISQEPPHEHGIACPECGALNQHNPASLLVAKLDSMRRQWDDAQSDDDADDANDRDDDQVA